MPRRIADPDKAAKKAKRWADIRNWLVVTSRITPGDDLLTRGTTPLPVAPSRTCNSRSRPTESGTKWTSGDIQRTPEFERICGVDGDAECVCGHLVRVRAGRRRAGGAEAEARGRDFALSPCIVENLRS